MSWVVGQIVQIVKPGIGPDRVLGEVSITRVGRLVYTSDGKKWRANGIACGSQPERGIGLAFAMRIKAVTS